MALKLNKGFTLAEVLITLVIIGVIAAITIPTLMANARRQEASARLKKFYSTLRQANIKAKAMGNDWEEWADTSSTDSDPSSQTAESFAQRYLLPNLNYLKTEISGEDYYVYLTDGSYFYFRKRTCLDFYYDVNGKKKPNTLGKDIFVFLYCPYSEPNYGTSGQVSTDTNITIGKTRGQYLQACKSNANYCSTLIMMDGWEFKEDYPHSI